MASRWQSMGTSVHRRSLQHQEQLEDSKELQPVVGHQETSAGALGSLCRQFQRRLPLRAVNLNLRAGPSWKRLETPEPGQQGLQAAARSAKSALGAVSQGINFRSCRERIQESCQSGTKWLVETQVKARRRKRGAQKGSGSPTHSLSQKSTRLSVAAPAHSAADPWEKEHHHLSARMGLRAHPLRRSRREAAFRSPYSSTEPLCSPSESDSDLEPVGAGIQHLQKLSQELDEAIMAEERKQALSDRQSFILKDVYASP
ncbi:PIMREG isoform 3 [Pongo abelii]|uniref:PIMREG isoform 3 n=1 Tax=Pongo abelii TaxID=9601 RepID=A0A2J8RXF3_PONAB|nr:PIMREG isoform 3 [Pongo abelii]